MNIKSWVARRWAKKVVANIRKEVFNPIENQKKVLKYLVASASQTEFGKAHHFPAIKTYSDFQTHVPLRDYEKLKPYVEKIKKGQKNILWKGKPLYLCKTSGTTSGTKYIPLTNVSIQNQINSARKALFFYIENTKSAKFLQGKMLYLSGSPMLSKTEGEIPIGRLSGIVNRHIPNFFLQNQVPTFETNCIEDWETKVETIIDEILNKNITLVSGIPSWVKMFFERLIDRTHKKISEIFPTFSLLVHGGVDFSPYKSHLFDLIGKEIDTLELFPASEGFFAFQNTLDDDGLLLNTNDGIFYEFIAQGDYLSKNFSRISLADVKLGVDYVMVVSTNAGLWGYDLGDTVRFISKAPYKLIVSGRVKHFLSAFGEHVIAKEVNNCMKAASEKFKLKISDFTVAPQVTPSKGLPYHEWFIEFSEKPKNLKETAVFIDQMLQQQNVYYKDLIEGKILRPLVIRSVKKGSLSAYMKSIGKLGGQNKIPQLSNDRKIANFLA